MACPLEITTESKVILELQYKLKSNQPRQTDKTKNEQPFQILKLSGEKGIFLWARADKIVNLHP